MKISEGNKRLQILALGLALFLPTFVYANDSAGTSSAGGIIFQKTPTIVLEQEKLTISPDNIHVSYLFKNKTKNNLVTSVFFPLPPYKVLGANIPWDSEINPSLTPNKRIPFINFSVQVNHQKIIYHTITRAIYGTRDVTLQLKNAGVPLNPVLVAGDVPVDDTVPIKKWQSAAKKLGLLDSNRQPLWHKQVIFQWQQLFPAGKTILVEHDYRPAAGVFFSDRIASLKPTNQNLLTDDSKRIQDLFSIDLNQTVAASAFKNWLTKQIEAAHSPSSLHCINYQPGQADCIYAFYYNVNYILTTGANWAGPIKNFYLTLHYPLTGTVTYNQFYQQPATTKVQPGQVQIHIVNFLPKQDLQVLFADKKTNY